MGGFHGAALRNPYIAVPEDGMDHTVVYPEALAWASVRSLLTWLDANGSCERRQRARD